MTAGTSVDRRPFSAVSAVTALGDGRFGADVDPEWTIMGKPNGGYLLAMLGHAAVAVGDHPHVVAASAHYVSSPDPGPVTLETELLRSGRSASQVRARLVQDGTTAVEALFMTSVLETGSAPYWDGGVPEPEILPFEDCVRLPPQTPDGLQVAIMEQVEVRLEPAPRAYAAGAPSGRGELRGWLRLPGDEAFEPTSLLYAVDSFPPATLDVEPAGWVPTFELTVYVRALPVPGPVRILHRAHLVEARRVDESCLVWDQAGRLVAQATQLAGIRLG
ncbi:MAG: thioesterase family protein [Acidimicrobiales bacterium]|nr:thioesterase family protein [Acidimicrobiales bacterium]